MSNKQAVKNQEKAKALVAGAVGTFSKAIIEVRKANELLEKAVEADSAELLRINDEITNLYKKLDAVQSDSINKKAEIIQNKELIAKLEKFTR